MYFCHEQNQDSRVLAVYGFPLVFQVIYISCFLLLIEEMHKQTCLNFTSSFQLEIESSIEFYLHRI